MVTENLEELAGILHAFEDPDSALYTLDESDKQFEQELREYQKAYENLDHRRKIGLRLAVVWFLSNKIKKSDRDLEKKLGQLAPKLYERIWVQLDSEEEQEYTKEIIEEELDTPRYIAAMKYILNHADQ